MPLPLRLSGGNAVVGPVRQCRSANRLLRRPGSCHMPEGTSVSIQARRAEPRQGTWTRSPHRRSGRVEFTMKRATSGVPADRGFPAPSCPRRQCPFPCRTSSTPPPGARTLGTSSTMRRAYSKGLCTSGCDWGTVSPCGVQAAGDVMRTGRGPVRPARRGTTTATPVTAQTMPPWTRQEWTEGTSWLDEGTARIAAMPSSGSRCCTGRSGSGS